MIRTRNAYVFLLLAVSCVETAPPKPVPDDKKVEISGDQQALPGKKKEVAAQKAEAAPAATARLGSLKEADVAKGKIADYFAGHIGRRLYVQVDKPIYKPGETIWWKAWDLKSRTLDGDPAATGLTAELVSPKGAVVQRLRVHEDKGAAPGAFDVAEGSQGGEYTLRVIASDGEKGERPIVISTYEPPRIKFKLEFVRKAYGAGDEVSATIALKRPTGEPLRKHALQGMVRLDGQDLPTVSLKTDDKGDGLIKFTLPAQIATGDGLLTVLADEGGLTESISKRIPIIVNKLQFSAYPEGGQMIEGVPGRIYFEAKNPLGKPADVAGRVVDDHGQTMAKLESYKEGLGRFELTPSTGRSYHVEIDKPVGVTEKYALPVAVSDGCTLRSFDDLDGELAALRVAVRCAEPKKVIVVGMLRENLLDAAAIEVRKNEPAIVYLEPKGADAELAWAQGTARVTVFDQALQPLAERLVYRNRRARLGVKVETHKPTYSPRDQVTLTVTTTGKKGAPQPAELALSVADDTVVSFADDKTGHMLSRLYLEGEIPGKVEEPNLFFDLTEEKSALGMDLLMGTRGWRKFEWQPVFSPPPPQTIGLEGIGAIGRGGGGAGDFGGLRKGGVMHAAGAIPPPAPPMMPAPGMPAPVLAAPPMGAPRRLVADAKPMDPMKAMPAKMAPPPAKLEAPAAQMAMAQAQVMAEPVMREKAKVEEGQMGKKDRARMPARDQLGGLLGNLDGDRDDAPMEQPVAWAPVRVFPAPTYGGDYDGPRTDFRETIYWQPSVKTGKDGKATVTFYLSDAVTSFRIFSEGVGGGAAGRDETVLKSSLPFSMAVKAPAEVSEGDKLRLPLVLTNERDKQIDVQLTSSFGNLLTLDKAVERTSGAIAAGGRDALFFPLTVTGTSGKSKVVFSATAAGLKDEFERELTVVPLGFPMEWSKSGQLAGHFSTEVDLGDMLPNTGDGQIKLYASPVATMVSGLDGMLREPSGCFEQTSSTNYPNVMILRYLKQNNLQDPQILERASKYVDQGYKRLVGFETKDQGYEWFGSVPPHEALSAYGLVEFLDMKEIYPEVDSQMVDRTAKWLRGRRDGKGGYLRDAKQLDSFGGASPAVTNAYITWSLTEAKQKDLDTEINESARLATSSGDAYLLALYANTLANAGKKSEALAAVKRLVAMQDADGAFKKAESSITRSGGINLTIETTSLAILAMLRAGGFDENVRHAVEWLYQNRGGYGQWGSTQATVLALKAMTLYAQASARTRSGGSVTLRVNGQAVQTINYEAGRREPIVFQGLGQHLKPGKNQIELVQGGKDSLPFSMAISYRSLKPATSPETAVELTTALQKPSVKLGETVRLDVTLTNKTQTGQPMTLARIGIPGGLSFQTWQLKELREKGAIAFYETQAREIYLYLRELKPGEVVKLPIDLLATTPGEFTAPASSAYLYYTDEFKSWADGTKVAIEP